MTDSIAFIGGGNMASALVAGLIKQGLRPQQITVIDPDAGTREALVTHFGVATLAQADASLSSVGVVVWAVKPQVFQAASAAGCFTKQALHLSVAAGVRTDSIARWLGTDRIVRAMPNTPALVGQGISGLYARPAVSEADKALVNRLLASTGATLWLDTEDKLDVVTALSGSGPAYVFYFMEAMTTAGTEMGLDRQQAQQLAIATFVGASALAQSSGDAPQVLRQRVTSKGGTTFAAISSMEDNDVRALFIDAIYAARERARTLGDEFGAA